MVCDKDILNQTGQGDKKAPDAPESSAGKRVAKTTKDAARKTAGSATKKSTATSAKKPAKKTVKKSVKPVKKAAAKNRDPAAGSAYPDVAAAGTPATAAVAGEVIPERGRKPVVTRGRKKASASSPATLLAALDSPAGSDGKSPLGAELREVSPGAATAPCSLTELAAKADFKVPVFRTDPGDSNAAAETEAVQTQERDASRSPRHLTRRSTQAAALLRHKPETDAAFAESDAAFDVVLGEMDESREELAARAALDASRASEGGFSAAQLEAYRASGAIEVPAGHGVESLTFFGPGFVAQRGKLLTKTEATEVREGILAWQRQKAAGASTQTPAASETDESSDRSPSLVNTPDETAVPVSTTAAPSPAAPAAPVCRSLIPDAAAYADYVREALEHEVRTLFPEEAIDWQDPDRPMLGLEDDSREAYFTINPTWLGEHPQTLGGLPVPEELIEAELKRDREQRRSRRLAYFAGLKNAALGRLRREAMLHDLARAGVAAVRFAAKDRFNLLIVLFLLLAAAGILSQVKGAFDAWIDSREAASALSAIHDRNASLTLDMREVYRRFMWAAIAERFGIASERMEPRLAAAIHFEDRDSTRDAILGRDLPEPSLTTARRDALITVAIEAEEKSLGRAIRRSDMPGTLSGDFALRDGTRPVDVTDRVLWRLGLENVKPAAIRTSLTALINTADFTLEERVEMKRAIERQAQSTYLPAPRMAVGESGNTDPLLGRMSAPQRAGYRLRETLMPAESTRVVVPVGDVVTDDGLRSAAALRNPAPKNTDGKSTRSALPSFELHLPEKGPPG